MNIFIIIILTAIFTEFILNFLADFLNIKMLKDELPKTFEGFYDPESYKKSQEYLRINTKFGWLTSIISLIIILVFWFGKGFPQLDNYVRSFGFSPVVTGIIYIGILIFFKSIISIPFSYYSTFVIEEKFGFNKTTKALFFIDLAKGIIISIMIGVPLLTGILLFFQYSGKNAWLYCWIASTIFVLIIQYILPTWILPIFNKFEPLGDGDLKESIFSYANSINFSLENIYVMDGSKRSTKANAFFTGFGKNKRIVLFDTLIEEHTVDELLSILAHEMGHYKKKHIQKMMLISILNMGLIFFILSFFISHKGLFDAFYMNNISIYAGLLFFGMLYTPIGFFTGLFIQDYSRRNEYEADRFAVETTSDYNSLITALKKLSVNNLSNLLPHPLFVFLNYSHPPVLERISAMLNLKK